jgi:hypothetical protein
VRRFAFYAEKYNYWNVGSPFPLSVLGFQRFSFQLVSFFPISLYNWSRERDSRPAYAFTKIPPLFRPITSRKCRPMDTKNIGYGMTFANCSTRVKAS